MLKKRKEETLNEVTTQLKPTTEKQGKPMEGFKRNQCPRGSEKSYYSQGTKLKIITKGSVRR